MDSNLEKKKTRKALNNRIIKEYIFIFLTILAIYIVIPLLTWLLFVDDSGLDNFAQAFFVQLVVIGIKIVVSFIMFIIYPIRFLVKHGNEFKEILSKVERVVYIFIVVFPIFLFPFIAFDTQISIYMYKQKYETGKDSYTVEPEDYILPINFYTELKKRNLYFNEGTEDLMERLNADHDCINYVRMGSIQSAQKCYSESIMSGIDDKRFTDSLEQEIINDMNQDSYPVYIYNAIIVLPGQDEKMQYAALGRYSYNNIDIGDYKVEYNDYYIECKILYVNGNMYAILGLGQSFDATQYNERPKDSTNIYNFSHNMILSEKDTITTFVDGAYYPNGSIKNEASSFEMKPNINKRFMEDLYPIRKVNRIDYNTINAIAEELQNGVLKESIEQHFIRIANKNNNN